MFGKSGNGRPVVSVAAMLFAARDFPLSGFPAKSAILLSGIRFSQSHRNRCGLMELAVREMPFTPAGLPGLVPDSTKVSAVCCGSRASRLYADLILILRTASPSGGMQRSWSVTMSAASAAFWDTLVSRCLHASANMKSSRPPSYTLAVSSAASFSLRWPLECLAVFSQSVNQTGGFDDGQVARDFVFVSCIWVNR